MTSTVNQIQYGVQSHISFGGQGMQLKWGEKELLFGSWRVDHLKEGRWVDQEIGG